MNLSIAALSIVAMSACKAASEDGGSDTSVAGDTTGPTIEHDPIETSVPLGEDVVIEARVTDDESAVFVVKLFYKDETGSDWLNGHALTNMGGDTYQGVIPAAEVTSSGMDYFLHAVDGAGNATSTDTYHFRIDPG